MNDTPFGQVLSKRERLRKRHEFLRVQRDGKRFRTHLFVVIWHPGPTPWARLGITTSKRVGGAVIRARGRRLIREVFRRNKHVLPSGTDIVFIVSPRIAKSSYQDVAQQVTRWVTYLAERA